MLLRVAPNQLVPPTCIAFLVLLVCTGNVLQLFTSPERQAFVSPEKPSHLLLNLPIDWL